jgi:hypothetical protein
MNNLNKTKVRFSKHFDVVVTNNNFKFAIHLNIAQTYNKNKYQF